MGGIGGARGARGITPPMHVIEREIQPVTPEKSPSSPCWLQLEVGTWNVETMDDPFFSLFSKVQRYVIAPMDCINQIPDHLMQLTHPRSTVQPDFVQFHIIVSASSGRGITL